MNAERIGEFLKNLRLENGMSQEELAEKLFVSRQAISNWEVGKSVPDYDTLVNLSDIYNIKVEEILRGKIIYKNKIYRFFTNIFSEKNKKKKILYIVTGILLFLFIFYMFLYFVNTYGKISFYEISDVGAYPYGCRNGILAISNDTVLYKGCDLTGFDDVVVKEVKYYYIHDGKERLIEARSSSDDTSVSKTNIVLNDFYDYSQFFEYKHFDEFKDSIFVDVVTEEETITMWLSVDKWYSSDEFLR